ncbi:hypothetical protein PRZ48_008400 [Zasmidium cellare]|uniref:Sulfhydryl oxidase n=1 Tax=Zasmidium cellare TaxID=395010 RepID=A0ABR0EFD5_ZASCE|nr:hypothetical protein PRZ48_008400 [Zasmidium cellare]
MPVAAGPSRRYVILLIVFSSIAGFIFVSTFRNQAQGVRHPNYQYQAANLQEETPFLDTNTLTGHAIAPKLGNETAKAELGRAAWKLFHTTMARFPDKPTEDESSALKSYIHLFQRLYPCGECAEHFGELLKKFPPQVSSRSAAAAWACHVHNQVNKRLSKEMFDCANIGDFYDCGCADDEDDKKEAANARSKLAKPEMSDEAKERLHTNGRDFDTDLLLDIVKPDVH